MPGLGNPLGSMSGAIDSLGLSSAAKQQADEIAQNAKKKKLQQEMDLKSAGTGGMPSAFQTLTGYGSV